MLKEISPRWYWKDWCWSWNSNTLATSCEELTHLKRPWCWERLKAGGDGDDKGWDGWMASLTQWTWVWVDSGSWWWTGRPGVLWFMGSKRVGHDWVTELKKSHYWVLVIFLWENNKGRKNTNESSSVQYSSVAQSCLTLCDPMDCSMPGSPVFHQLLELAQTHVRWVSDAIPPSHLLSSPSPPAFSLSQHQGLFHWVSSSRQVAKVLELQLQHQSFQWIFRTDFLLDWLHLSDCMANRWNGQTIYTGSREGRCQG